MTAALPTGWALAAAIGRWLLYCTALLAVGSVLFLIAVPAPDLVARTAARLGRVFAILGTVTYLLAIGFGGADLLGMPAGPFAAAAWTIGARTTLLPSAVLGCVAMALVFPACAFGTRGQAHLPLPARIVAIAGIGFAVASFLVTGHPASTQPRWLMSLAAALHVLGAAFWLGALAPLSIAAAALPASEAASVMTGFSRRAAYAVTAIIFSGVAMAWIQLGRPAALIDAPYGLILLGKLALVAVLLACALYNKRVLTPALTRALPQRNEKPAERLRLSITLELILFVLIFAAAEALTFVPPPRELLG